MKIYNSHTQQGFTLIEILLYLTLSVVMVALIGGIGVNVLSGMLSAKGEEEVQYNAQFITETLRSITSEAEAIDSPTVGATSSVLTLTMADPDKTPTVIYETDDRLFMQEGTDVPQLISGSSVEISNLEFTNVTQESSVGSVQTTVSIRLLNPNNRTGLRSSTTLFTTSNLQYP